MTALGAPLMLDCEDVAWFRDQPEAARGAAAALGRRTGLGEHRTAELVLAVAELATNMTKHAVDGSLLLRVLRDRAVAGVEVVVVDSGPGMSDVEAALRDGTSTAGTLGIGLGSIRRLADTFHVHSQPELGTVQVARFWPHPVPASVAGEPAVQGITRPIGGEQVCGDAWAARLDTGDRPARTVDEGRGAAAAARPGPLDWSDLTAAPRPRQGGGQATEPPPPGAARAAAGRSVAVRSSVAGPGDGVLVMSCDGLGHGPMAALAATAAVQAFRTGTSARTPEQVVEHVHRALRGTRGAAVAVARLEPGGRVLFCGVGNISAVLVAPGTRAGLLSHPGIVGHQMHQLRTYEQRMPADGVLVMHSDGLSERWKPADLAGLLHHSPGVIAAALLRRAGTRRDDASALVAKAPW